LRGRGSLFLISFLALAIAAPALANNIQISAADQARATHDLLTRADLGSAWKGGPITAIGTTPSCKGFRPNTSNIVTTGRAEATYRTTGLVLNHSVNVLERAAMLGPYWKATYASGFLPCLKTAFFLQQPPNVAVVSATKVGFPRLAQHTTGYRLVYEVPIKGGKPDIGVYDLIALGNGRTELVLTFEAILGTAAQSATNQKALATAEGKIAYLVAKRGFS
jgi:hypothetical protein